MHFNSQFQTPHRHQQRSQLAKANASCNSGTLPMLAACTRKLARTRHTERKRVTEMHML